MLPLQLGQLVLQELHTNPKCLVAAHRSGHTRYGAACQEVKQPPLNMVTTTLENILKAPP